MALADADDSFHPPANSDRWWTETCWFSFDEPSRDLSATIYPLFRPNLGVCSLAIYLWDAGAFSPWEIPYAKFLWHLAMPTGDLTNLTLEGLRYECVEPRRRYRVRYRDEERLTLELDYRGLREPWVASHAEGVGHLDQPCHVTGTVVLDGEEIAIDCLGMRDRTWSPRPDDRGGRGAAYTYGHASADDQFLLMTSLEGNNGTFSKGVFGGYLVRDGVVAPLVQSARRVIERAHDAPARVEIEALDELGRSLEATGRARNRFANHATPGSFAWMSMIEWSTDSGSVFGEDQEVWSIDRLGKSLRGLTPTGAERIGGRR